MKINLEILLNRIEAIVNETGNVIQRLRRIIFRSPPAMEGRDPSNGTFFRMHAS